MDRHRMKRLGEGLAGQGTLDLSSPQKVHEAMDVFGHEYVLDRAADENSRALVQACFDFRTSQTQINYLHSGLCAMHLPVRAPADETKPWTVTDGRYKLIISPKPIDVVDGEVVYAGIPYGAKARLALAYIMTEAKRTSSPEIYTGQSIREWMRRLGYTSFTGGPRGTMTVFMDQVKRVVRSEWTFRFDGDGESELLDVPISNEQTLFADDSGKFTGRIRLSDEFFDHLMRHDVPLRESALGYLRDSPTCLDIYTFLAYRLPRVDGEVCLSWDQFGSHFGNDNSGIRSKRAHFRRMLEKVLVVYPEARVDLSSPRVVRLFASPPPIERDRPVKSYSSRRLKDVRRTL